MKWKTYYQNLNREQRESYAANAGTTTGHIETHLLSRRKIPRKELMSCLAEATNGACLLIDLLSHFYDVPEEEKDTAA
ncbi:MAG: hypothetical protein GY938_01095 [Ketobacter sp.]|nr:hypothetical protein [Ketobacter sp.]